MKSKHTLQALMVGAFLVPALIFAAGSGSGAGSGSTTSGSGQGIQDRDRIQDRTQDPTTHTGDEPLRTQDQDRTRLYQTTTTPAGTGQMNQSQGFSQPTSSGIRPATSSTSSPGAQIQYRLQINPEKLEVRARTSTQLEQMIQTRTRELAEEASTTQQINRESLEYANRVRLAVYSLLAAENLLPTTTGHRISQLAQEINSSVQTSANAEAQLQNRSFIARLLFGGDITNGQTLAQIANQNQERIRIVKQLLAQASSTSAVHTQLQTQLQTMEQEQERILNLGLQQQRQWGLFSWRL